MISQFRNTTILVLFLIISGKGKKNNGHFFHLKIHVLDDITIDILEFCGCFFQIIGYIVSMYILLSVFVLNFTFFLNNGSLSPACNIEISD